MKSFVASTALTLLSFCGFSSAAYSLTDNYVASNFFSNFNFYTGNDPTNGYVNYIDQSSAQSQGLINTDNNQVYIGVDYKTVNPSGRGRNSIRLETKKQFTHGLFLLDLNHMPGSVCGTWPAFWTYGPNWPTSGEIDILEGVNSQSTNDVTLHTGGTCKATSGGFSGQLVSSDCSTSTGGTSGCSIHATSTNTYGTGLNNVGGGVYAMEWTSSAIKVWFFARNAAIPSDISSGQPDPSSWGTPQASFPATNCNIDDNFKNHYVVFDNTFCGDWAGAASVWSSDVTCSSKASTCQAFVAANPSAFQQSYWNINSLKVYQSNGAMSPESESSSAAVQSPIASTQPVASTQSMVSVLPGVSTQPVASSKSAATTQLVTTAGAATSSLSVPSQTFVTSRTFADPQPVTTAVPTSNSGSYGGNGWGHGHGHESGSNTYTGYKWGGSSGGWNRGNNGNPPRQRQKRRAHAHGAHDHHADKFF